MAAARDRKVVPLDLARAGEARHFIAWRGAVAGLGGGKLNDLAVAAEAALTDVLLSPEGGMLKIQSEHDREMFRITISHPALEERRMADLPEILGQFLDGYELSPTRTVLEKRL